MKMPNRGQSIVVDGYGRGIFAGARNLHNVGEDNLDEDEEPGILLKFEGSKRLESGYGNGIIFVPYNEYKDKRIHIEQYPDDEVPSVSTEKRDEIFEERFN